jgi:hypothetical protein
MKKTTKNQIFGGMMVAFLLATVGAVIVNASSEETDDTENFSMPFMHGEMMWKEKPFDNELTDEQQEVIDEMITSLTDEGATCEEIREAIDDKLDEMGILDQRLDNAIEYTEQKLVILNRQNELRDQGYDWDEINDIIQEEFDLEYPTGIEHCFGHGPHRGFDDFISSEETNQ